MFQTIFKFNLNQPIFMFNVMIWYELMFYTILCRLNINNWIQIQMEGKYIVVYLSKNT